jgi:hypothetical protein
MMCGFNSFSLGAFGLIGIFLPLSLGVRLCG